VLAAGNQPDFRTIADFRKTHLPALRGFFEQVLRLARELGAPRVGRVARDSSKVKANASKHKAMSYGRMRDKQRQLREEVKQLLDQAEAADAAEDAEYGPDRRGDELPAELQRRESRLKRIRDAKGALEAPAKDEAAAAGQPADSATPDPKAQYNFTDPESRIMKGPDGFVQAYNVQVAVDDLQFIVGQAVTQETNDKKQLMPMVTTIEQQSGVTPTQLLADAGYCSDESLSAIATTQIDAYISTRKQKHGERPGPCPRGPLPTHATIVDRMARKLLTKTGAAAYAARKGIVEPVIGQIKQARGFRQFLLRGFEKVQGEWSLVCTTHNILKLHRLCV
jgi:DDE family transposase